MGALSGLVERGLMAPDWAEALAPVDDRIAAMGRFLRAELAAGRGYLPAGDDVFKAFRRPLADVRVLVVGQDPYPTPGHPIGLSFAVARDVRPLPGSLRNIYQELSVDLGIPPAPHGDLTPWADQGVMLLNRVLTVRPHDSNSHRGRGWEEVTDCAIDALARRGGPAVAILWGRPAQTLKPALGPIPWVESAHPSPLSAARGFFGSRPFSQVDRLLVEQGAAPVDWALPRMSRPAHHLTPHAGFLNDPTGLVRLDDGWHAWYQLSPGRTHGDVSWGHAVSDDLVTWRRLPVSIASDDEEEIWTGSVVVDADDTAGFGRGALVAAYTRHEKHRPRQSQALAVSTDGGLTWDKHGVVLDIGSTDFRDPRLLRHDGRWVMVVARALEDLVAVYTSPDLRDWTHASDVAMPPCEGRPWECPDLFPLGGRWVLLLSREPATYYLVGDLEGTTFSPATDLRPLDVGPDLYAGVTFGSLPDEPRVLMGWLDNWAYAQVLPTDPWRGQLSCARRLSLATAADGSPYVVQRPVGPVSTVTLDRAVELAPGVVASYDDGLVRLTRSPEVVAGWAGTWTLPSRSSRVDLVVDSHSVEVFTVDGLSASLHTLPKG